MAEIRVLRIGHRPDRDKRVTTHTALTARALGAKAVLVDAKDNKLEENVRSVVDRFGGDFSIETGVQWRKVLREFDGKIAHLTMYGMRVDEAVPLLQDEDLLVVVGAEKVPPEVYQLATVNVSVGNQPHSEIAALAIFMDRLTEGRSLYEERGGRMKVIPNERGKTVIDSSK